GGVRVSLESGNGYAGDAGDEQPARERAERLEVPGDDAIGGRFVDRGEAARAGSAPDCDRRCRAPHHSDAGAAVVVASHDAVLEQQVIVAAAEALDGAASANRPAGDDLRLAVTVEVGRGHAEAIDGPLWEGEEVTDRRAGGRVEGFDLRAA